ncbi:MAG: DmsE family decaheme c-type cytochrome [Bryobacteraceae bacterium]
MKLLRVAQVTFFWTAIASASDYVGSDACKTCHAPVFNQFFRNPHYQSISSSKESPENAGCESCHGPGKAHIAAHGGKATIIAFSEIGPEKTLTACLRCHSQTLSRANIRKSAHTQADVVCTNCHSIHNAKAPKFLLAKQEQRDLCYSCHSTVKAQFSMPFKHRVNEGSVNCTDCHNPHGTFAATWGMAGRSHMVDQKAGNEEACLKCHSDKRGPFVYEHASVRIDGCQTCHMPHGSNNPRMLTRPAVFTMCLECHNGAGQFGIMNNGVYHLSATHNMADPRYQNCTTCHVRIHGSNADPLFMR